MGNCCVQEKPVTDLRERNSVTNAANSKRQGKGKAKNPFKQNQAPQYKIESRVSIGQAARENTQQILEQKQHQDQIKNSLNTNQTDSQQTGTATGSGNNGVQPVDINTLMAASTLPRESIDQFNNGKFTFEPSNRLLGVQGVQNQNDQNQLTGDNPVSFGIYNNIQGLTQNQKAGLHEQNYSLKTKNPNLHSFQHQSQVSYTQNGLGGSTFSIPEKDQEYENQSLEIIQ
eukprot:403345012